MFNRLNIVNNQYMSKFKLINIIDSIFLIITIFFIVFAWVQFFVRQLFLSCFITLILVCALIFFMRWLKTKQRLAYQLKQTENAEFIKFKLTIQTMPNSQLIRYIKKLIPSAYSPKSLNGDIYFTKNSYTHIFTFCYNQLLDESTILNLIKTKKTTNLTIFCSSFNNSATQIASAFKNIKIGIITIEQLYQIFKQNNIKIDLSNIDLSKAKVSLKGIVKNSLSRSHAKGYFISGLILLLTSLIVPFKIYYVVFSSALFVLSILCKIKPIGKTNPSLFD